MLHAYIFCSISENIDLTCVNFYFFASLVYVLFVYVSGISYLGHLATSTSHQSSDGARLRIIQTFWLVKIILHFRYYDA